MVIVLGIGALAGIGGEAQPEIISPDPAVQAETVDRFSTDEHNEFMKGCATSPDATDYCQCAFDYLETTYGREHVLKVIRDTPADELSQAYELEQAYVSCAGKY